MNPIPSLSPSSSLSPPARVASKKGTVGDKSALASRGGNGEGLYYYHYYHTTSRPPFLRFFHQRSSGMAWMETGFSLTVAFLVF